VYFFELKPQWTGGDLRAVYRCTGGGFSGYMIYFPDRSISLWPVLGLALVLPTWALLKRKLFAASRVSNRTASERGTIDFVTTRNR
jgi:hypothetical protein